MKSWRLARTCRYRVPLRRIPYRPYATKNEQSNYGHLEFDELEFPDIEVGRENAISPEYSSEPIQQDEIYLEERDLTPEDVRPPFAKAFTKIPDDVRTHRARKYGNKPLPLSPAIDPVFVATRNRWKMKKELPPKPEELTPFQKALQNNPYARALATPVRHSQNSLAKVPNFFLLSLDLRRSPQPPHALTFVPSKLWAQTSPIAPGDPGIRGTQSYIDLLQQVIEYAKKKSKVLMVLGPTHHAQLQNQKTDIEMRKDIGPFVLDLLRQGLMKSLVWAFKHNKAGIIECCDEGAYNIEKIDNVACVLYIDRILPSYIEPLIAKVTRELQESERYGKGTRTFQYQFQNTTLLNNYLAPPGSRPSPLINHSAVYTAYEYALVQYKDRKVPVYSLAELLGEEKTAELLRGTKFEGARCVVLREGERSVKAQMWLLRLRYFLSMEFDGRPYQAHEVKKKQENAEE